MITIKNYCLEPYTTGNTPAQNPCTEWLREAVNKLMRDKRPELAANGVDTSLFYNHATETGQTRVGYPLVIYHHIDGLFYLTGINEGAQAVEKLAAQYPLPFAVGETVFKRFRKANEGGEYNLGIIDRQRTYKLVEWRPIHHQQRNAFNQMGLVAKAAELNTRLEKHLTNELGKYLNIGFDGLKLEITDIDRVYEPMLYKNRHFYPAFDIRFKGNITLPPLITLGNHQALGYGRVEPL